VSEEPKKEILEDLLLFGMGLPSVASVAVASAIEIKFTNSVVEIFRERRTLLKEGRHMPAKITGNGPM